MAKHFSLYFQVSRLCHSCYHKNPKSALICHNCGQIIMSVTLTEKEKRMLEFSTWFMDQFVVDGTGDEISLKKMSVKSGYVVYDFGRGKFSWAKFFLGFIHYIIGAVIYLISYYQKSYWRAWFNDLGWLISLQDNQGAVYHDIMQAYALESPEYKKFCDANPQIIKKNFISEMLHTINDPSRIHRYVLIALGVLVALIGVYFDLDGK